MSKHIRGWEVEGIDAPFDGTDVAKTAARRKDALSRLAGGRKQTAFEHKMAVYRDELRRLRRDAIFARLGFRRSAASRTHHAPCPSQNRFEAPQGAVGDAPWSVPDYPPKEVAAPPATAPEIGPNAGRRVSARPAFGRGVFRPVRTLLVMVVAIPAVGGAAAALALGVVAVSQRNEIGAAIEVVARTRECAETTLYDAQGFVLARPARPDSACPHPNPGVDADGNTRDVKRPFLTMPYASEEEALRAADDLAAVEGRYRVGHTIYGVDPIALVKNVVKAGQNLMGFDVKYGFSGPILTGVEFALGESEGMTLQRKMFTFLVAAEYTRRHLKTDYARAQFVNATVPAILDRGNHVSGALADRMWFGDEPPSLAQRCMRASASKHFVRPVPEGDPSSRDISTWSSAGNDGATLCITRRAESESERTSAMAELNAMCPEIACRTRSDETGLSTSEISMMIADAYARHGPASMSRSELAGAETVLEDARRLANIPPGTRMATTLDPAAQVAVHGAAQDMRAQLRGTYGTDVWLTVGVFDLSDQTPKLLAATSNEPTGALSRPPVADGDGGFVPGHPTKTLGSVNKTVLALFGHTHGIHQACSEGACETMERAIGRSATPPFYNLADRLGGLGLAEFRGAMGYVTPEAAPEAYDLAHDAVHGSVARIAPLQAVGSMAALMHGAFDGVEVFEGHRIGLPYSLPELGVSDAARRQTLNDLRAVFAPGGTLRGLRNSGPVGECTQLGKSGTHNVGDDLYEKLQLVVHTCGDTVIGVFVAASALPDALLPKGLSHSRFAELHRVAAKAAYTSLNTGRKHP